MIGIRRIVCLAWAVTSLLTVSVFAEETNLPIEGFTKEKYKACVSCHQSDPVKQVFRTKHADADNPDTPASKEHCEACHGPSAAHANFPLQVKNFHFGDNSANSKDEQSAVCLNCHEDEQRDEWKGGMHDKGELGCADCHTVHKEHDPLLDHTKTAMVCVSCHEEKKTAQHIKGLHIIESGKASCTDCHNPHASLDAKLCVNCHDQDAATLAKQSGKAQEFHATVIENELSCLKCHRGVAHGVPRWVEEINKQQNE